MAQLQADVEAQAAELAEYAGNDPDRYDNLSEFGGCCGAVPSALMVWQAAGAEGTMLPTATAASVGFS